MSHRLARSQLVGGTLDEVFAFFKDPRNLGTITPPWLGFRILGTTDAEVRVGTRIRYRLSLHGIPMRWESRIAEYTERVSFADEQLRGPYKRWYHRHLFRAVEGGVMIEDIVEYELPLGILGRIAHAIAVRRQLASIFDYRARVMGERFPLRTPTPAPDGRGAAA